MKMELIECSETSDISTVTPGNYPEENILHTEHGESLKSRTIIYTITMYQMESLNLVVNQILVFLTCFLHALPHALALPFIIPTTSHGM